MNNQEKRFLVRPGTAGSAISGAGGFNPPELLQWFLSLQFRGRMEIDTTIISSFSDKQALSAACRELFYSSFDI